VLLLPQLCIHIVANHNKKEENLIDSNTRNENNVYQSVTTVSIDHVLPKIDLEIEHVLIGVENCADFLVSKIGVVLA